jgi:hypothetical protein
MKLKGPLLLTCFVAAAPALAAGGAGASIACPQVMATRVLAGKYRGWEVYSNDPLRLTGADVEYDVGHEEALLDPDETRDLNDPGLSVAQIFRLKEHAEAKDPWLICHYGEHAQLSREIPRGAVQCEVVHHRSLGQDEIEFEASCR